MKRIFILFTFIGTFLSGFTQDNNHFSSLFNGNDLCNWIMLKGVPAFNVTDGVIITTCRNGSDLFTQNDYGNFILKFEYLLSEVGNSGVFIRCDPDNRSGTGFEVQLLAPWTPYRDDLHCTGSIYGHVAVSNRPDETTGIWHTMEIKCDRKKITVSVDDQVTTVANTDTVESMKDKHLKGKIGFQSNHSKKGEYAKFRNIIISDLDAEPEYVQAGFYEKDSQLRKLSHEAAVKIGAPMIEMLVQMLGNENPMVRAGAKQVLFDITAQSTSPDLSETEKRTVAKALQKGAKHSTGNSESEYLGWLIKLAESYQ
jgi:hypothetical protein